MTRKKVELAYITNNSKRKTTFKKRKHGLIKKTNELSILCGIKACGIIYTPDKPEPVVWPSEEGVKSVISKFKAMPEAEQQRNMLKQKIYMKKRIMKAQEKLKRVKKENKMREMNLRISRSLFHARKNFDNANVTHLNDISHLMEETKRKITDKRMAQKVTPVVLENEGGIMTRGKKALVNHVLGLKTNVAAMKILNRSFDNNNNGRIWLDDVCLEWLA